MVFVVEAALTVSFLPDQHCKQQLNVSIRCADRNCYLAVECSAVTSVSVSGFVKPDVQDHPGNGQVVCCVCHL